VALKVIINIVFYDVVFVGFSELVKGVKKALIIMNTLEFYQQTYTYDIGNNLTALCLVTADSLFCFVLGGQIQPQCGLDCLGNHPMAALPSLLAKTKPKCNKNATATRVKKETTVVVCATTVPDT
jgi:hypothetical protein